MTEQTANPRALIEHVAKALVNTPDQVIVEEVDEDGELVIELEVAEDDMGRVIGKSGKIARAMRNLLHAAGTDAGQEVDVVLAPAGQPRVGVEAGDGAAGRRAGAEVGAVRRHRGDLRHLDDGDRDARDLHGGGP